MIDLLNDSLHGCFGHTMRHCSFTVDRPLQHVQYGNYNNSYVASGRQTTSIKVGLQLSNAEVKALGGSDKIYETLGHAGNISSMSTNFDPMNGLYFYDLTFIVGDLEHFAASLDNLKLAQKIYEATFHEVLEQELKR